MDIKQTSKPHTTPCSSLVGGHALVIGAGKLIGTEITRHLAQCGANVTLVVRKNIKPAKKIAAEIHQAGGQAQVLTADIADEASINTMLTQMEDRFGPADFLVNNAGAFHEGNLLTTTSAMWDDVFQTNAKGVFISSTAIARRALQLHRPASIVNIAGASAERCFPGGSVYAQAKAAAVSLTKQMALEWGPYGIRVNAISPGPIRLPDTPWQAAEPELAQEVASLPMRRAGTPADVAKAVSFLLGPDAGYITGQNLAVDGGSLLTWYITRSHDDESRSDMPHT